MEALITALLSFAVIVLVIAAMSVGVIAGRSPIKGSCGGVAGGRCELCSGTGRCRKRD